MTINFVPIDAALGASVDGFDPAAPATGDLIAALSTGLADHGVLVFRGHEVTADQFVALGRAFGDLEILPEPDKRDPDHPEIFNLSNVRPDGQVVVYDEPQSVFLRGTERWHTDSSFREVPCLCTMLYAVEVPASGGETQFANMVAAYESLTRVEQEELATVELVHDYVWSRANNPGDMDEMDDVEKAKYPAVRHPLVRVLADGRRSLYLGGHASHVAGRPPTQGRALIDDLTDRATAEQFVYEHHWQAGDLVVWDNRSTLHRLRPYDIARDRRVMRRITVSGCEPVVGV